MKLVEAGWDGGNMGKYGEILGNSKKELGWKPKCRHVAF